MKTRNFSAASKMLIFIPLAMVCLGGCSKNDFSLKRSGANVDIKYAANDQETQKDLANHKYYDIEVYRLGDDKNFVMPAPGIPNEESNFYEVFFYGKINNSLFCSRVGYGSNEMMDKATYQWVNDTMASICLYNSVSNKKINFKVFGNSHGSGMIH